MDIDLNNFEVDNILEPTEKKKKINCKKKGNRVELELCKKLTARFGETFSRSVGSGNRWGQVTNIPEHAKQVFSGDICCPETFRWVIECKGGYDNDVDFSGVHEGGCSRIDEFIKQCLHDAEISHRNPIIVWKRSRQPWVAILRQIDVDVSGLDYYTKYRDWVVVSFDTLLNNTKKDFWYK